MTTRPFRVAARLTLASAALGITVLAWPAAASAAPTPTPVSAPTPAHATAGQVHRAGLAATPGPVAPVRPTKPSAPASPPAGDTEVKIDLGNKPSSSIVTVLALTLVAVAPALLLMMTSFTKIIVVLSLTRNALGLQNVPPNQVLTGLAMFLTLFIMGPVLSQVNHDGVQPYLKGTKTQSQAFDAGMKPLHTFMADHTRSDEIALFTKVSKATKPKNRNDVPLTTLIPAFVLSELRAAFVIGFVIFIPFLVIDLVVSSSLMSMGMMMLPPVMISLPFKLLLFLLIDGWGLVVRSLVASYA